MMHATKIVVALLGLAAAAPAQLHVQGRFGNHVTVHADIGGHRGAHRPPRHVHAPHVHAPIVHPRPVAHAPHLVPGHWETVCERVWVPPTCREECVPAAYGWTVDSCGRRVWGIVRPAHTRHVEVPGHFEERTRRVYVPGC